MAQFLLIALVLIFELKEYFIAGAHQLAPHIAGSNETGQAIITVMVAIEFLFHPLSLFFLYLALEGAVRFLGSLITAEIVPSLLVFLFFKISSSASRSIRRRSSGPLLADALDLLPDGRIRIASASLKAGWNASITIGIDGQWFELECEQQAQPPRSVIYVLRPSPAGKILRGYQEYDKAGALTANLATERGKEADAS
ncbi:MAG TPA: hypothetical protein VN223_08270 [Candidatus Elarobacter sp.]|nr:hypothetical protein [Candidatus Elarobacter sp.]